MVSGKLVAIAALVVCAAAVGVFFYVSLVEDDMFPGAELYEPAITPEFVVNVTKDKIYEDTEFNVTVTNKETKLPVDMAKVTFVVHQIHEHTNDSGVVFFTAPDEIRELYLLHPNDTMRAFPLTVQKAMYKSWAGLVKVYPYDKLDKYMVSAIAELGVDVYYPKDKIYERTEFKVTVTDQDAGTAIEGANVSFMIPLIYLNTNKEGIVYFSAPYISKATAPHIRTEYITSPEDTMATFPLTVTKDGYNSYHETITVYLAP